MTAPRWTTMRLEAFYRRLLVSYPARWRAEHADALIGVLLDLADDTADRRPRPSVVANIVLHGLRTRLATGASGSRALRDRASLIALASGAALSAVFLGYGEVRPAATAGRWSDLFPAASGYLGWLLALTAAACGVARLNRPLLIATAGALVAVPVLADLQSSPRPPMWLMIFLAMLALVACLGCPVGPHTSRPQLTSITATAILIGLMVGADGARPGQVEFYRGSGGLPVLGESSVYIATALAVVVALLVTGHRAWAGALLLNTAVWGCLVVLSPAGGRYALEHAPTIALLMLGAAATAAIILSAMTTHRPVVDSPPQQTTGDRL